MSTPDTAIRCGRISSLDGRHRYYCAVRAQDWTGYAAVYTKTPDMVIEEYAFTDSAVTKATTAWIARLVAEGQDRPMVMIGSTEYGVWVNWNINAPRPEAA